MPILGKKTVFAERKKGSGLFLKTAGIVLEKLWPALGGLDGPVGSFARRGRYRSRSGSASFLLEFVAGSTGVRFQSKS